MKRALVTGAPGFVGAHLCRELVENGYTVRALHRPTSNLKNISSLALDLATGDVTDKESLLRAMQGIDVVFHIAAVYREAKFPDEVYWKVNFEGTRNALEAAKESGVARFIHCSTTGVHGNIDEPPAKEDYRYAPHDVYQQSKTEAEKLVKEWITSGKIDGCIIRPTMIWGPNDTRIFKLFRGIARRALPIIGDGKTLNHWILVDDLVRAFRLAAENSKSSGQTYLIGGDRIVTLRETMETIARVYGVSLLPFRVPALPIQLVGSIVEALCRPLGIEPPIHRRRADFFIKSRAFDCTKARAELGFTPRFSFEKECEYVARWYQNNGWVKV